MTHHFGVLIPSTNTTVEGELARLSGGYQAHFARLMTKTPGHPFAPSRDEDIDYQSQLLGTAKVEMLILIQTSASLFADDYDDVTMRRMSAAAGGVPAITSAHAMGRALRALGAQRIGLVSPYSEEVNARARRYFSGKHGLEIAVLEGEPSVPPQLEALLKFENVVITPHIAGRAPEARTAATAMMLSNLNAYFAGKPLPFPVSFKG